MKSAADKAKLFILSFFVISYALNKASTQKLVATTVGVSFGNKNKRRDCHGKL